MRIDPSSSTPAFLQIAEWVRAGVASGVYRAGDLVPSIRETALRFVVNPNTVKRAYEELEREGLIVAQGDRDGGAGLHGAGGAEADGVGGARGADGGGELGAAGGDGAGGDRRAVRACVGGVRACGGCGGGGIEGGRQVTTVAPVRGSATGGAVVASGVSKRFGTREALRGVSLSIERGTTCGLIGLNGAGKSTLIKTLVGLLPPDAGTTTLGGVDVWSNRVEAVRNLGYVPDRPHTYSWMRVEKAIEFAAAMWNGRPAGGAGGSGGGWNAALASKLQKQYGLDGRQKCGKLSKGQGAKLSLLLALSHDPEILVLDEPTDGLDPIAREEFLQQVLESTLDREGAVKRTVVISSHALGDLQRLTDTVAVLHEGALLLHAPTEELVSGTKRLRVVLDRPSPESGGLPAVPEGAIFHQRRGREWTITLGAAGGAGSEEAARALRGMPGVSAVSVEDLSLDEVFKDLVRGRQEPARVMEGAA
ncbi:MAG: ATP-binding cassette domain-containing protein [Phycisphaerales bacterium]